MTQEKFGGLRVSDLFADSAALADEAETPAPPYEFAPDVEQLRRGDWVLHQCEASYYYTPYPLGSICAFCGRRVGAIWPQM